MGEINFINFEQKKPFNFDSILNFFSKSNNDLKHINNYEIAIIGDRLMTDTMLANLNNGFSIYCLPLDEKHENYNIKVMRKIENIYLRSFNERKRHQNYINFKLENLIKK